MMELAKYILFAMDSSTLALCKFMAVSRGNIVMAAGKILSTTLCNLKIHVRPMFI